MALFVLILGILFFRIRRSLSVSPKRQDNSFGVEFPSFQSGNVPSQTSTLVQSSNSPVSSPPLPPGEAPLSHTSTFVPCTLSPTLPPGHTSRSNMASPNSLLSTLSSSSACDLTVVANQRRQQGEPDIRIDARSSGSRIVFNFAPRQ